ncbi:unnamed protein product [Rotaria sp. Silwood2]|nr:unnamed protein product [Rotaria sp. Silwood2]CAF3000061.1 unnamed protein product [Rotaria sp. Silwood2]CAF3870168.1 unnamed protein product [Rotaria sp. Silwood2]CAF4121945.1 unnamed protein product [Rotaria sp. Silwood2]
MDVLELPRPVINFLRTMAKESCRYALSWDIFGGPDSVTLTLTWKLIDEEVQSSTINEAISSPPSSSSSSLKQQQQQQQQNYDNPHPRTRSTIKESNKPSSPRRSRRDENTSMNENISVPAIFRSSRGKSLEGSSIHSNKQIISHHQHNLKEQQQLQLQQHVSSLERQTITNHHQQHRTKKEQQKQIPTQSDQIYGNLYDIRSTPVAKCTTISSLSSSSPSPQPNNNNNNNNNNNPPLSVAYTHHQRTKQHQQQQQSVTPPITRKPIRSLLNTSRTPTIPITSNTSSNYAKLRRNNNITTHDNNNDDDDTLDPWVKRFECSFEDNDDETTEQSEDKEPVSTTTDNIDELGNTSGKVKFKTKPDYF